MSTLRHFKSERETKRFCNPSGWNFRAWGFGKFASLLILLLLVHSQAHGQSCKELIQQGRSKWIDGDVVTSQNRFRAALHSCPNDATANFLFALTRILAVPLESPGSNLLLRVGMPISFPLFNGPTPSIPTDELGLPTVPSAMKAEELTAFVRDEILPALLDAERSLASITDPAFQIRLDSRETRTVDVDIDYPDVLFLRAVLSGMEYGCRIVSVYNVDLLLSEIRALFPPGTGTLEELLQNHSSLLTIVSPGELVSARAAFTNAVALYLQSFDRIRGRPSNQIRLFNYDPEMDESEKVFRRTILDVRDSLDGVVKLRLDSSAREDLGIHAGQLFSSDWAPRPLLPKFRGNALVLDSLPDPTFGGTILGLKEGDLLQIDTVIAEVAGGVPRIRSVEVEPKSMDFHVLPGHGYSIERSINLSDWSAVEVFVAETALRSYTNVNGTAVPQDYYRLRDVTTNMPPPINDRVTDATRLGGLPAVADGYLSGATEAEGEQNAYGETVWYEWTSPSTAEVVISETLRRHRLVFAVYTGTSPDTLAPRVGIQESITLSVEAGETYFIQVQRYPWLPQESPGLGEFRFAISVRPVLELRKSCPSDPLAYSPIEFEGEAIDPDGRVDRIELELGGQTIATFPGGRFYHVLNDVSEGSHHLRILAFDDVGIQTEQDCWFVCRPKNDDFTNSIALEGLPVSRNLTNLGATREPLEPAHGQSSEYSVWFTWKAPLSGTVTVSAFEEQDWGNPISVAIYAGETLDRLQVLAQDPTLASFSATRGNVYRIALAGGSPWYGSPIRFGIRACVPALNVSDDEATKLSGDHFAVRQDSCCAAGRNLWWTWSPPSSGTLTLSLAGSDYPATLSVLFGNEHERQPAATTRGNHGNVEFQARIGQTYFMSVGTRPACGLVQLTGEFRPTIPLAAALDAPWLHWYTPVDGWRGTKIVTRDSVDAAESGPTDNGRPSYMSTRILGPGVLSFWWKVSSEYGWDYLELYVDGNLQEGRISGETDWERVVINILGGEHDLQWQYSKDKSLRQGLDRGWVDEIQFDPLR